MRSLSIENPAWTNTAGSPGKLALLMLFGDVERWRDFARLRIEESLTARIFSEIVIVLNREDEETVLTVERDVEDHFNHVPILVLFRRENNIPAARNAAIRRVRTEFVLIQDDDDSCDSNALREAFQKVFMLRKFPILELPLSHPNGAPFHPQPPELLPQVSFPNRDDLLIMSMVHTPFFATRKLLMELPIPEHVALRGEWLHWSTKLWRMGIPIVSLKGKVAMETLRQRMGVTASSPANEFSSFHAYLSLLFLFFQYKIERDSPECQIIRTRYFLKYCENDQVWNSLIGTARALAEGESIRPLKMSTPKAFSEAQLYLEEAAANGLRLKIREGQPRFNLGPYQIFNPKHRDCLDAVLRENGWLS